MSTRLPASAPADDTAQHCIAVIGGAFCGTTLAARLVRCATPAGPRIILIEKDPQPARGPAYRTTDSCHLLNVPAARMSAWPEEPDHFVAWCASRGTDIQGDTFAPRGLYGEYLQSILDEARDSSQRSRAQLELIHDQAVDVEPSTRQRLVIRLASGRSVRADHVVLATGNFEPGAPYLGHNMSATDSAYIGNPWQPGAFSAIGPGDPVLLIGTGLTMIDVAIALDACGHCGHLIAVSRRGLLPQPHRSPANPPKFQLRGDQLEAMPRSALTLLRLIREEIRHAQRHGENWREILNALRPVTPLLWRRLGASEQRRFIRHLRTFWDTHRHRVPPAPWAVIEQLLARARLRTVAGRVLSIERSGSAIHTRVRLRATGEITTFESSWLVNCSGPQCDVTRVSDPLMVNLLRRGLGRPDPLSLGLDCDLDGAVLDDRGKRRHNIWALGSLRKGQLWESTAVPELRVQVQQLAALLVQHFEPAAAV